MNKNQEIILINDTHLENIDKIIVILNEKNKSIQPEDIIIKQAENIIFDYLRQGKNNSHRPKIAKLLFLTSACFVFGAVLLITARLFI